MKRVEAIIRPEKLEEIISHLEKIGSYGVTVTEVFGHGKQKGVVQHWRGEKYKVDLLPKLKIEMVIEDKDLERAVQVIRETGYTGNIGDGKIFISEVLEVIKIRTQERGVEAL